MLFLKITGKLHGGKWPYPLFRWIPNNIHFPGDLIAFSAAGLFSPPLDKVLIHISYGIMGVRIFFVISGFLITYLLLKERARNGRIDFKAFFIRRALRILPAFYIYLFILGLLNYVAGLGIPYLNFLGAALFLQNFAPWGFHWPTAHSWSLAVEEQFYLLWPALFLRIKNITWLLWIAVIITGGLFRGFYYSHTESGNLFLAPFFAHADFLFSGCFLAFLIFDHYDRVVKYIRRIPAFTVYLAVAATWFFVRLEFHGLYSESFTPISGVVINVCTCFLILYFIIRRNSIGYTLLNLPAVTFLGRLSYSLYLWQQLFINKDDHWWTKFPQNVVLTFAAAYISYRLVETPFLRLKGQFNTVKVRQLEPV